MVAHPFAAWTFTMAVLLLLVMGLLEYHGRYTPSPQKKTYRKYRKACVHLLTCCVGEMSPDMLKESHSPCCFFRAREVLFPTSSPPISADHLGQGNPKHSLWCGGGKNRRLLQSLVNCQKQRKGDKPDKGRHWVSRYLQTIIKHLLPIIFIEFHLSHLAPLQSCFLGGDGCNLKMKQRH